MSEPLRDRVYVVTGASGAIAEPIVSALAAAGARLALVDRVESRVSDRALAVGGLAVGADLGRLEGATDMARRVLARLGRIDGLVHTVGAFAMGTVAGSDPDLYDRMFDANVRTLFYAVRAVLPDMQARGDGFIAGFASEPAWLGRAPGSALYGAAKSAVASLLRSLDTELGASAIRVAVVYPMGVVDTAANRKAMPGADPAAWIDPTEIAATLVHAATRSPRGRLLELPVYGPRA